MYSRQNDLDALRFLIAQRRLYRNAKRWLSLRWLGMLVIGIGAPVVSVISPHLAVIAGAVAGAWIFIGRTMLLAVQSRITSQAAAVQEQFDFYVFKMPAIAVRSVLPSPERISAISGSDDRIKEVAENEHLVDWYVINTKDDGLVAVAVAQRANAAYAENLLWTTAILWSLVVLMWCVGLVVISVLAGVKLEAFLLGIVLPVLPAFLDVVQYVAGVRSSAVQRADLARAIEGRLGGCAPLDPQQLLVWQERLFDLRRAAPEVPDVIYKLKRKKSEQAMRSAADQLSRRAGRNA